MLANIIIYYRLVREKKVRLHFKRILLKNNAFILARKNQDVRNGKRELACLSFMFKLI
jgi:DNA-binding winged helix-turn-helix (wHTH) protein